MWGNKTQSFILLARCLARRSGQWAKSRKSLDSFQRDRWTSQIFRRWSERSQVDTVNRCFVLFQSRETTQDSRQNNHWGRTQQGFTFFLSAVFYNTALEQAGRGSQNGVTRSGFLLVIVNVICSTSYGSTEDFSTYLIVNMFLWI